jgi:hypothetical protein
MGFLRLCDALVKQIPYGDDNKKSNSKKSKDYS